MYIEIITTPVHDALGITSVSTSVEAEVCRIAQIDFASFLTDVDLLTLVLYCSHPSVYAQYLDLPNGDYRNVAAEKANNLSTGQISQLASEDFFNRFLRQLLDIGRYNSDWGAKLVPVFACLLEHQKEYCLDDALVDDVQMFLTKRDFVDGYTIISQDNDTCCILPSIWGKKVA